MINPDGTFSRKYTYAVDRNTGEAVVLPMRNKAYQMDPSAVFYKPEVHAGNITCANCALPDIGVIDTYKQAGGKLVWQHYKVAQGQKHHLQCDLSTTPTHDEHTKRDKTKGPVIFLNGGLVPLAYDFNRMAKPVPEEKRLVQRTSEGKWVIQDADLEPRPRDNAKSVDDFFKFMIREDMTKERLDDSWIIFGESKIKWDKFFIRGQRIKGMTSDLLDPDSDKHPVLLHVRMKRPARSEYKNGGQRLKIGMQTFDMTHPVTGEEVTIHVQAYVRDKKLFPAFRNLAKGEVKEFFALTTPFFSEYVPRKPGEPNLRFVTDEEAAREEPKKRRHIYVHFNIKPQYLEWKTLAELKAEMQKKQSFLPPLPDLGKPAPV